MTNLETIQSLQNKFGEFKYELNDNKEVITITIDNKGVKSEDLKLIGELTNLKGLYLPNNQIDTIQDLKKLIHLKVVNFSSNQIPDSQIEELKKQFKTKDRELIVI